MLIQTRLGGHGVIVEEFRWVFLKKSNSGGAFTPLDICQGIHHAVTLLCCPGMGSLGQSYRARCTPLTPGLNPFFGAVTQGTCCSLQSLMLSPSRIKPQGSEWVPWNQLTSCSSDSSYRKDIISV